MIKEVEVRSLRGLAFRKGAFEAARINIITGCNGAYKTTLLEAMAAALLTRADRGEMYALAALASTMRMDDFWLYSLLRDGFEISIDGTRYRGTALAHPGGYGGRIEDGEGAALEVAISVIQIPTPWGAAIQYNTSINPNPQRPPPERPARFVAFATPNPITQNFVYALMKISNLAKAVELLQRLYGEEGFKTITIKHDELNRPQLYISVKDRDLPVQYLGSGYAAVLLLTLAATRDTVLYDLVENHLHPWLIDRVATLMREAGTTQWIVTTQSLEAINIILTHASKETNIVEISKRGLVRTYPGDEALHRIEKLEQDLRGNCL